MEKEKLTILIVDDQRINRQILAGLLRFDYDVLEAENGAEALEQLEHHEEIAAILLDLVMPVMDGYEFLRRFKETPCAELPIIAVTGDKDAGTEQKVLDLGAWDFVSKPYHPATLLTRLKNVIIRSQYYLVSQMKFVYEHDPLTELLNRTAFFTAVRHLLEEDPQGEYAMVRVDIDRFQTYNSFWGEEEGDKLLRFMADWIRQIAGRCKKCVYGRINADAFCLCVPNREEVIRAEARRAFEALADYNKEYRLVPSFGVYEIHDKKEKPQKMYELATLAAHDCKGSYLEYISYYKPEMSKRILENQWIVNEMQKAMDAEQFEVYLQPKYDLDTEAPYGAEALIRWRHPEKGMLSPGIFIPVFEQNGFIGKIDHYMWEHVCCLLRKWIDEGRHPGPISVNVSRVNLYNPNLVAILTGLVEQYRIPVELLHLEMTESAYMANPQVMERVVEELQNYGFVILMDDFGSGYSSLNTLKDIHVNILKIDMKFLAGDSDMERSRSILASAILMAGWLHTPVIMEGVETAEQAAFLKSIGCNYVQGYYFAKPMPVSEYEQLIDGKHQVPTELRSENLHQVAHTLWSANPQNELLFNSLEEPVAVYELAAQRIRVLRVNESFHDFFESNYMMDKTIGIAVEPSITAEEQKRIIETCHYAAKTKETCVCCFSLTAHDQTVSCVKMVVRYWGLNEASSILFAQFFPQGE
ncbi:two-component system response regulator [Acidaminobacterium chupaoyuni]